MSDHKNLIQSVMKNEAFIKFHADTARMLNGVNNAAILLQFLIDRDAYHNTDNSWFYLTEEKREAHTNISNYQQREAVKILKEKGIIETKRKGVPATTWFKINYETYHSQLLNFLRTSSLKTKELDNKKLDNYLLDNNKSDSKNKLSKDNKGTSFPVNSNLLFLLEEWRLKDTTPNNQKHPKEGTKLHKKIAYLTNLLLKGKFSAAGTLDQKFLDQNEITKEMINHEFTEDELLGGLDEMAKMFHLDNYPEDKTAISKMPFDHLIYHPTAKISYLLKYIYCDVQPLVCNSVSANKKWLNLLYENGFFDESIEDDSFQFGILKKGLVSIEDYFDWMQEKRLDRIYRIETDLDLLKWWMTWVDDVHINNLSPYDVGTQSKRWWQFIKWLEEAIQGDYVGQSPSLDKRKHK